MEGKASFGQVQVPFQGYDGKRSLVYTEVLDLIVYKVVVMYYSALQVSQGAVGQFLKLYHCLFRFLFGEMFSVEPDSNSLMGNNGKQSNGLFLKEVSLKGSVIIIWEIKSL